MVRPRRAFRFLLILASLIAPLLLGGCQVTYLVRSAYDQAKLLASREPLEKALESHDLTDEEKRKLRLAEEAHHFAETDLGLKTSKNYSSFVKLDRPYVTYVVSAAEKNELKPYKWWFPIVGSVPYKGFFNPDGAKAEAEKLKAQGFDVYVRGVSAFSTLGWFNDPILSSMLRYRDIDLVNTIIHETVHATIYIKSEADFNERLAVFIGNKGAEEFYRKKEGSQSKTLQEMRDEEFDDKVFSEFIAGELKSLEAWYADRRGSPAPENERQARLREIQERFKSQVRPRLKLADSYKTFETGEINNARLMTYRLYFEKLDDFEAVFRQLGGDFHKMLAFCKGLESSDDPKGALAKAAAQASGTPSAPSGPPPEPTPH